MSDQDGFELEGIEPVMKIPEPERPVTEHRWDKLSTRDRPMCDLCLSEISKKNSTGQNAIPRAMYVERGPVGKLNLCPAHKQARITAVRGVP